MIIRRAKGKFEVVEMIEQTIMYIDGTDDDSAREALARALYGVEKPTAKHIAKIKAETIEQAEPSAEQKNEKANV